MKSTLELVQVSKSFTQTTVLIASNYTFKQGEKYLLRGPSGSGKSTLLYLLAGLELPTSGKILYNGSLIHHGHEYLQKTIGLVFQYPYLIPELSVIENVMLKARIAGASEVVAREQAKNILQAVALAEPLYDRLPGGLSGGEQQRVALARALMGTPDFLLVDEVTAHLDEQNKLRIRDLLDTMQATYGYGLIISSHEPELFAHADHVIQLHDGTLQHVR